MINLGLDVGSTTVKLVAIDKNDHIIFSKYKRHYSNVRETIIKLIWECYKEINNTDVTVSISGSGGISIAKLLDIDFIQEVIAGTAAVEEYIPETDIVIELGGEDAKITYFTGGLEQRMNGTCAGGTGSFIDQMAALLNTDASGLNELAKKSEIIYPIAARCGVFAKTDVQPLLNEGAKKEDIAASILQAVVNQTISGLACGRKIEGNIAFLGGPLSFLSELRKRFIITLELKDSEVIFPENAHIFVALGAAISSRKTKKIKFSDLINNLDALRKVVDFEVTRLEPLFKNQSEIVEFRNRHEKNTVDFLDIAEYKGNAYLGIDAGSTTTKVILLSEDFKILYSFYGSNEGTPLDQVTKVLKDLYMKKNDNIIIRKSCVTGYGEGLIKTALKVDLGEVETVAHYRGAKHFLNDVQFILDIGGQDMKCLKIKDDSIDSIMLNEACSSGCGSFIETFAKSLKKPIVEFAQEALLATHPVDLGSRCTVFMNSRVKQAQKEGATVGDISAGLSYSVIKNALLKVIKIRNMDEIGDNIIVQGGTFYNEAVLRAFEKISGKNVIRPSIAGLMGAFGAAILAKDFSEVNKTSTIVSKEDLDNLEVKQLMARCKRCSNNCLLTVNRFSDNTSFVSGNRCEKGSGEKTQNSSLPNLFEYKYMRAFQYTSLDNEKAIRGTIGVPRVLNMYENYPFWHEFLTSLKFNVVLSSESNRKIFELGMDSIPSESVCYPAKIAHGHIVDLIDKGIDTIFYPSVVYEEKEVAGSDNCYNCPVVASYSDVIKNNVSQVKNVKFLNPFITLNHKDKLISKLYEALKELNITKGEIRVAVEAGYKSLYEFKNDIRRKGEEVLQLIAEKNIQGIVLAGRPYHLDPEINHGIPKVINSYGMAVLTEDSIAHLGEVKRPLRVLDQWVYHSRLYNAAAVVANNKNLNLIQLTSFGCGLDAVTADQVQEILEANQKLYTLIKIDEISNLGAIKIRLRSLQAAIKQKEHKPLIQGDYGVKRIQFTKEMKKNHTILVPQMAPIHFELIHDALLKGGFNAELLPVYDEKAVDAGLRFVNNDACYPSIITVGQLISALQSGKYDLNNTSVLMTQTGGGCRASNYVGFIRKAFKEANLDQVPVIALSDKGIEKHPGLKFPVKTMVGVGMAMLYGDVLMRVLHRIRPYEKITGSAEALYDRWMLKCKESISKPSIRILYKNIRSIINDFDNLEITNEKKPRVGIVGEILVKFHPMANNDVVKIVEDEGGEAVVPDLLDFFMYGFLLNTHRHSWFGLGMKKFILGHLKIVGLNIFRAPITKALKKSKRFESPRDIKELANMAKEIVSLGNQTGEGWLLTAEMIELIECGAGNIICMQPFGCLPNHITGKGVVKALKEKFPLSNIVPIDYDPGASEVNQINRIKLMMTTAFKNLDSKPNKIFELENKDIVMTTSDEESLKIVKSAHK